ncbi:hypothetical protein CLF_106159 [Clonorchis sinensis]|uniref:Uncharacterized protein n=1 Tax=Clonorchis sinensis TaxID=79923 RepID=G7YPQ6_CLOSI|nr:hypothetical protein CLF_106159 [Clonorchis sinensis]
MAIEEFSEWQQVRNSVTGRRILEPGVSERISTQQGRESLGASMPHLLPRAHKPGYRYTQLLKNSKGKKNVHKSIALSAKTAYAVPIRFLVDDQKHSLQNRVVDSEELWDNLTGGKLKANGRHKDPKMMSPTEQAALQTEREMMTVFDENRMKKTEIRHQSVSVIGFRKAFFNALVNPNKSKNNVAVNITHLYNLELSRCVNQCQIRQKIWSPQRVVCFLTTEKTSFAQATLFDLGVESPDLRVRLHCTLDGMRDWRGFRHYRSCAVVAVGQYAYSVPPKIKTSEVTFLDSDTVHSPVTALDYTLRPYTCALVCHFDSQNPCRTDQQLTVSETSVPYVCLPRCRSETWRTQFEWKITLPICRGVNFSYTNGLLKDLMQKVLLWFGQPGNISALVLPSGGIAARYQKDVTAEQHIRQETSVHHDDLRALMISPRLVTKRLRISCRVGNSHLISRATNIQTLISTDKRDCFLQSTRRKPNAKVNRKRGEKSSPNVSSIPPAFSVDEDDGVTVIVRPIRHPKPKTHARRSYPTNHSFNAQTIQQPQRKYSLTIPKPFLNHPNSATNLYPVRIVGAANSIRTGQLYSASWPFSIDWLHLSDEVSLYKSHTTNMLATPRIQANRTENDNKNDIDINKRLQPAVTSKRITQSWDSEPQETSRNLTTISRLMAPKEENYEKQTTTESANPRDNSRPQSKKKTTESQQNTPTLTRNTPNEPTTHTRLRPTQIHRGPIKIGEDHLQSYQMPFGSCRLRPNKPYTTRQIRKLLAGFKVQSSEKTSLMGAPPKELPGAATQRSKHHRGTFPTKSRQNAQEAKQTRDRPLSNSEPGRPEEGEKNPANEKQPTKPPIEGADKYASEVPSEPSTQCLKSMDYETRLVVLDLFPLEYRRLRGDLILTYALFEQGLANRFFTVDPANTRRRHGERQLLNDKNKTDPGNLGKSLAPVYQSVNP